jgi:hypothetical protein
MSNKKLIQQYANTGAILPKYQAERLPKSLAKSYIRRRLQQYEAGYDDDIFGELNLNDYEVMLLPLLGDENTDSSITMMIWQLNDFSKYEDSNNLVKSMVKNMSEPMIKKIFSNVSYYGKVPEKYDEKDLFSVLAHKYGSIEDDRSTISDVIRDVIETGRYDEDEYHYIEADILDDPLPAWAKGQKAGYFYMDSTMDDEDNDVIFGLSKDELIKLIKDKAPKMFDLKDE